jgi:hypothetical protein
MSVELEDMKSFIQTAAAAKKIMESDVDWETKYGLIFGDISMSIRQLKIILNYYDPDTSYEDDVRAYYCAIEEKADEFRKILEALNPTQTEGK